MGGHQKAIWQHLNFDILLQRMGHFSRIAKYTLVFNDTYMYCTYHLAILDKL